MGKSIWNVWKQRYGAISRSCVCCWSLCSHPSSHLHIGLFFSLLLVHLNSKLFSPSASCVPCPRWAPECSVSGYWSSHVVEYLPPWLVALNIAHNVYRFTGITYQLLLIFSSFLQIVWGFKFLQITQNFSKRSQELGAASESTHILWDLGSSSLAAYLGGSALRGIHSAWVKNLWNLEVLEH